MSQGDIIFGLAGFCALGILWLLAYILPDTPADELEEIQ